MRDEEKILNALRIAGQLIHPGEQNRLLKQWRQEIMEAVTLQENLFAAAQKSYSANAPRR